MIQYNCQEERSVVRLLVEMARGGKDEMAMYMLHNLKPYAIEIAEGGKEKDEPEIDIDALLSALFG